MKKVGFWRNSKDEVSSLPWPEARLSATNGSTQAFLVQLKKVESKACNIAYQHMTQCKLCGSMHMSKEFTTKTYNWPQNYFHYVAVHNVEVPEDFVHYIHNYDEIEDPLESREAAFH